MVLRGVLLWFAGNLANVFTAKAGVSEADFEKIKAFVIEKVLVKLEMEKE